MRLKTVAVPPKQILTEIISSLAAIESHGSVEIFVQNRKVTQITVRNIKKTGNFEAARVGNGHRVKKGLDKVISIY